MAQGFDAPPTIERSGSEHRRAVTSFLLRRKAWLEVELSDEQWNQLLRELIWTIVVRAVGHDGWHTVCIVESTNEVV